MKKIESFSIGDKAEISHKITKEDITKFAELTGDDNKLHVDNEFASKTSFKKPVVHGMLGASFISTIIGTKLPGDGALWYSQSLEFLRPVRIGDEITVKAEIKKITERTNEIELSTEIFNQFMQKVTTGTAKVKIIEQETESSQKKENQQNKKVALIIGATGGIGEATCIQLAKDGFSLAIHYNRNLNKAQSILKKVEELGEKATIVSADINNTEQVKELTDKVIRKFETITVLVNASTPNIPNIKFKNLKWEHINEHILLNIKGTFNLLQHIIPVMEKNKYGKIVNLTTEYTNQPVSELSHYITGKAALEGFTRALAFELAPKGIRLNLVSPGMTDTGLIADVPEKVKLLTASRTPLRRIANPADIANTIAFLASEKSDFLTGETIRVNGGNVMI
jgi:3-oxoacyl-[acyl-carrier protein] reductase